MEPVIVAKKASVNYGTNKVISAASFEIDAGDFVCVVGANGSGKSTLVKAILGLVPLSGGTITFGEGVDQRKMGFLPQDTRVDLYFPATVDEIVLSGTLGRLRSRAFYRQEDKKRAERAMRELGVLNLRKRGFSELSGGQKQKVLLSRALAATSKLLILDEPSNNLDHKSRADFYNTLKKLNEGGLTIMMITHDLDAEDLIGNKVLALKDGEVLFETTAEFLRRYKS